MTFIFWFLGNSLIHAPVIEDGWKVVQNKLGSVTWEQWMKTHQENSGRESGLVLKQKPTKQNLKYMKNNPTPL